MAKFDDHLPLYRQAEIYARKASSCRPRRCPAGWARPRPRELAGAFRYMLTRWTALTRCFDDGRLALDNNLAERALRGVAVGRKNYLFAGSDRGAERAAALYSLIETAKLNGLDPETYLRDVPTRIADHPVQRLADLLPWNWAETKPTALAA